MELHEDDGVFEDRPEGSNEPGKVLEEVLLLDGVEKDLELSVRARSRRSTREHTPAP